MSLQADDPPEWFAGAIDLHVHSRPSIFPRLLDDHEVAAQAARAGMRGVVLKAHEGSTVERAELAQASLAAQVVVRGGVVLNHFVGGINAHAVELALGMGGSMVWMPTIHARNHVDFYGQAGFHEQSAEVRGRPIRPVTVVDDGGELTAEANEVLEVVAAHPGVVLNNGHLGAEETAVLFREATRRGIDRRMVAHPELPLTGYSLEFQLELARAGAVIERCYLPHTERWGGFSLERTAEEIRRIGADRCVLSTDFGQANNAPPAEGLERFAGALIRAGLREQEVARMIRHNPAVLLGLE